MASWTDLERTLVTGDNAFERVFGKHVWAWFDEHPDEREMFAQAMMGITVRDAPQVATLYPFAEVKTVCDVGGGRGTLLSELLIRHPHLHGILCDGAGVLDSAKSLLAARGVESRVTLSPGSFFEAVPTGADVYVLKNILHDWDDATCRRILTVVRRAMAPGQRLVIVDAHIEKNDADNLGAFVDLQMMMVCANGRERSRGELEALLSATGFRPGRCFPYPTVSVLEGLAV